MEPIRYTINFDDPLQMDILGYLAKNYPWNGIQDNVLETLTKVFDAPLEKIANAIRVSFTMNYQQAIDIAQEKHQKQLEALAKEIANLT
jgi:hypothetical protein